MNWKKVIDEISAKGGMTQVEMADAAGLSQSCICYLSTGRSTDPKWSTGNALLKLHEKLHDPKRGKKTKAQRKAPIRAKKV